MTLTYTRGSVTGFEINCVKGELARLYTLDIFIWTPVFLQKSELDERICIASMHACHATERCKFFATCVWEHEDYPRQVEVPSCACADLSRRKIIQNDMVLWRTMQTCFAIDRRKNFSKIWLNTFDTQEYSWKTRGYMGYKCLWCSNG